MPKTTLVTNSNYGRDKIERRMNRIGQRRHRLGTKTDIKRAYTNILNQKKNSVCSLGFRKTEMCFQETLTQY